MANVKRMLLIADIRNLEEFVRSRFFSPEEQLMLKGCAIFVRI